MSALYSWTTQDRTQVRRNNEDGSTTFIAVESPCPEWSAYLAWLDEGNTPDPAPAPPAPVELTPAEKLAASGLTVEELKGLLGLK